MLDFEGYRQAAQASTWEGDANFRATMQALLSPEAWANWEGRFAHAGALATTTWAELAEEANRKPPELKTYGPFGDRLDQVQVHPAYERLAREGYEAGLVWPRFSEERAPWVAVLGLGYLFAQAEQGLFCPVCLTAGSAWVIERFASPELKARFLPRVAAAHYDELLEGAMFLTERAGGSDVGAAETVARQGEDGVWRLFGDKWFSSNAGRAGVMMVLARPEGAGPGTKGLGLFLVPWTKADGTRNAIRIKRLKDKLGTKSMPSGELDLEGAEAYVVGALDQGFAQMAAMLNLSRLYNAVASLANLRRVLHEAKAYLGHRKAFGQTVLDQPMVRAEVAEWTQKQEAATRLVFAALRLLDREDAGSASPTERAALRALTPMIKAHTARLAVDGASWGCEALGGNGYIEEWPMARFLRDAQVLPIWEGTSNILALDLLRAGHKEGALTGLVAWLRGQLGEAARPNQAEAVASWGAGLDAFEAEAARVLALPPAEASLCAKALSAQGVALAEGILTLAAQLPLQRESLVAR